jgi:Fe-S cluster biogenesis protein NfuA/nitrite reductase/ring-hydroxylating ferredoxin subunit
MQDAAVREEVQELEELLARVEELPDGDERDAALAAIQGLLRVYGEALRRVIEMSSPNTLGRFQEDELLSQLLLLHDLHPTTLQDRIVAALEEVRPYMGSHGGGIELIGVSDGVARVTLQGTCSSCAASTLTLKLAVEEAVLRAAPDLHAVEAIEPAGDPVGAAPAGPLLPMFQASGSPRPDGRWIEAGNLSRLNGGGPLRLELAGAGILFARSDGTLYAYRDHCPACRDRLAEPRVQDGTLGCSGCGRRYDLRRAGIGVDGGLLQLEPVPLLEEGGEVRVALEAVPA